jgi:hypothetical protein
MAIDFETPTVALFTRLSNVTGVQYATRVLEDWDSTAPANQPALMLTSGPAVELIPNSNLQGQAPQLWKLQLLAVLYVQTPDPTVAPSTILNPLISGVLNALVRTVAEPVSNVAKFVANAPGQFATTLGGLCAYCRAFGTIERAEGLVGHVAVAHIPIEMVLST